MRFHPRPHDAEFNACGELVYCLREMWFLLWREGSRFPAKGMLRL